MVSVCLPSDTLLQHRLFFLGSKITADGDCSHEIKDARLLLGRKAMTKLDSIFKSKDVTLLGAVAALCWSSHEEMPHVQGKRNPRKMVGVARRHQRADTLKPESQKSSQFNHTRTTALSNSMKLSQTLWGLPSWAAHGVEV